MVRVKVCGITNWSDALLAVDSGANALGFNFYRPSPRYIAPADARRIIRRLPRHVCAVGVFVNAPVVGVLRIARAADLDALQLHGDETPFAIHRLAQIYPVIKAFRVGRRFRLTRLKRHRDAAAFLLDGFDRCLRGGTGKTFEWRIAGQAKRYGRVILAGGLNPENVARAIAEVEPYAIDVCGGVETRPGKKDPRRVKELMAAVEAARQRIA